MNSIGSDLARTHMAELLAGADNERLASIARGAQPARARRSLPGGPVVRVAVTVAVSLVLASRLLPITI